MSSFSLPSILFSLATLSSTHCHNRIAFRAKALMLYLLCQMCRLSTITTRETSVSHNQQRGAASKTAKLRLAKQSHQPHLKPITPNTFGYDCCDWFCCFYCEDPFRRFQRHFPQLNWRQIFFPAPRSSPTNGGGAVT